jgi:hypothetical protein
MDVVFFATHHELLAELVLVEEVDRDGVLELQAPYLLDEPDERGDAAVPVLRVRTRAQRGPYPQTTDAGEDERDRGDDGSDDLSAAARVGRGFRTRGLGPGHAAELLGEWRGFRLGFGRRHRIAADAAGRRRG